MASSSNENQERVLGSTARGTHIDPAVLPLHIRAQQFEDRRCQRERENTLAQMTSTEPNPPINTSPIQTQQLTPFEEHILTQGTRRPWDAVAEPVLGRTRYGDNNDSRRRGNTTNRNIPSVYSPDRIPPASTIRDSYIVDTDVSFVLSEAPMRPGPHRDGYSEEKCRNVLILYCSWIPRHFDYAEGVKRIYPYLREYLGDENLDLATGVLYEMIEIPSSYTWDEGAIFQRWKSAHMKRARNFENTHVPALGNIIVGSVIPTDSLLHYRQTNVASQGPHSFQMAGGIGLSSIRSQKDWQIEYSTYISGGPGQGTRVHKNPPSPAELHKMVWDRSLAGAPGRLVDEKEFKPSKRIPQQPRDSRIVSQHFSPEFLSGIRGRTDAPQRLKSMSSSPNNTTLENFQARTSSIIDRIKGGNARNLDNKAEHPRVKCGCDEAQHKSSSATIYEMRRAVQNLPDPDTPEGHACYSNVWNQAIPDGSFIPTEAFARKNQLTPQDPQAVAATLVERRIPVAEDLAIYNSLKAALDAITTRSDLDYRGPFTNELFKDAGLDFQWDHPRSFVNPTASSSRNELRPARDQTPSSANPTPTPPRSATRTTRIHTPLSVIPTASSSRNNLRLARDRTPSSANLTPGASRNDTRLARIQTPSSTNPTPSTSRNAVRFAGVQTPSSTNPTPSRPRNDLQLARDRTPSSVNPPSISRNNVRHARQRVPTDFSRMGDGACSDEEESGGDSTNNSNCMGEYTTEVRAGSENRSAHTNEANSALASAEQHESPIEEKFLLEKHDSLMDLSSAARNLSPQFAQRETTGSDAESVFNLEMTQYFMSPTPRRDQLPDKDPYSRRLSENNLAQRRFRASFPSIDPQEGVVDVSTKRKVTRPDSPRPPLIGVSFPRGYVSEDPVDEEHESGKGVKPESKYVTPSPRRVNVRPDSPRPLLIGNPTPSRYFSVKKADSMPRAFGASSIPVGTVAQQIAKRKKQLVEQNRIHTPIVECPCRNDEAQSEQHLHAGKSCCALQNAQATYASTFVLTRLSTTCFHMSLRLQPFAKQFCLLDTPNMKELEEVQPATWCFCWKDESEEALRGGLQIVAISKNGKS